MPKPNRDLIKSQVKWDKRDNRISRKELRDTLDRYSRKPFVDALTAFLRCRPDDISVFEWARQHPDRWANAVNVMAKLSGYADQQEINLNITDTSQMSDAQLLQRLMDLRERLNNEGNRLKESETSITHGTPVPVQNLNTPLIEQQQDKEKAPSQRPGAS